MAEYGSLPFRFPFNSLAMVRTWLRYVLAIQQNRRIEANMRPAYKKYPLLCSLNRWNSVIITTIKLPNALLQNHAAVIMDFIDGGASVNENVRPGIESHTSPIIIKINWGNCHKMEIWSPLFSRRSICSCKIPAHTNDRAALMPPITMLFSGAISMLQNKSNGTTILCHNGIINSSIIAPTAFACNQPFHHSIQLITNNSEPDLIRFEFISGNGCIQLGCLECPTRIDLCKQRPVKRQRNEQFQYLKLTVIR